METVQIIANDTADLILCNQALPLSILPPMEQMERMIQVLATMYPHVSRDEAAGHVTRFALDAGIVTI